MEYNNNDEMVVFEMLAIHDSRKSFYGKARIAHNYKTGIIYLISYDTVVCLIDNYKQFHKIWSGYSVTTMRHINEFINQYGIVGGGKHWWDSLEAESLYKYV